MNTETLLYGRKLNSEEWQEELLSTNPARFDEIKQLAVRDGFGHFRVASVDLTQAPDFKRTLNIP